MPNWNPAALTRNQWLQAEEYHDSIKKSMSHLTETIVEEIELNTDKLVANNNQLSEIVTNRLDRLGEINEQGLWEVKTAVNELADSLTEMHSDMNFLLGSILHQFEIQNNNLKEIIQILKSPNKTLAYEFFSDASKLISMGIQDKAEEKFIKAINIDDSNFLFHYHLGLLYLTSNQNKSNQLNLKGAQDELMLAYRLCNGEFKLNKNFKESLIYCKHFLALSYYYQLTPTLLKDPEKVKYLVMKSIALTEEAVNLDKNFSQGYYHLALYYALIRDEFKLLENLKEALELDVKYVIDIGEEKIFDNFRDDIEGLFNKLILIKLQVADDKIYKYNKQLDFLILHEIAFTEFKLKFYNIRSQYDNILNKYYNTKTYVGYALFISNIDNILLDLNYLKKQLKIISYENLKVASIEQELHKAREIKHEDAVFKKLKMWPLLALTIFIFTGIAGWIIGLIWFENARNLVYVGAIIAVLISGIQLYMQDDDAIK